MSRALLPVIGIVGFALAFVILSIRGNAGQFAKQLRPFVGRAVRVEVFGRALPDLDQVMLHVAAVQYLGLGLWIRLRLPSGRTVKLKIAQPTTLVMTATTADVSFAGYAQWDSRRIKSLDGHRAPGSVVITAVVER